MQTRTDDRVALELALGARINELLAATRTLSERSAAQFHEGLRPAAFHIARWLHAFGPANPSVVAQAVAMDRSSTSTLLRRMREIGLVETAPDTRDRRGVIVQLTHFGERRVIDALEERGAEFLGRLRHWSSEDLSELERLLGKLTREQGASSVP